ncbi:MAG: tRNA lysidine(34) synthetase TilS [Gemmatimonadetes bacterium]|nr:tRNA lysidine(34) synthetase TilS [Gemmatimonadota bacterium]
MELGMSPDILHRVEAYIQQERLLTPGDGVVVALSGGPDSVTLFDLLHRLKAKWDLTLYIAHLNHQLRPNAESDAAFVKQIARNYPVYIGKEDVVQRAKNKKQSLEEAARDARRAFLDAVKQKTGANRIALGHTKSDQAETVLFRLVRGSGLTGLGGIRPISEACWIRPLLSISRPEIESYVRTRNLQVLRDETNSDPKFLRNRIRTDLIPHLQKAYNPQIEDILSRSATLLQNDDAHLENIAEQALSETLLYRDSRKFILDVKRFFGYHISLRRRLIRKVLFALQASAEAARFQVVERILDISSTPGNSVQITPEISAYRTHDTLIITQPARAYCFLVEPDVPLDINGKFSIKILNRVNQEQVYNCYSSSKTAKHTVFFDLDQLPNRALYLRSPRPGDWFHPFGMQGKKKVSRLFGDSKIPRPLRGEIPLLVSGVTILWVVGLRRSQIAPITPDTRRVLKATYSSMITQCEKRHL